MPSSSDHALGPFLPLLERALARPVSERFQTAAEFMMEIEKVAPAFGGLGPARVVSKLVQAMLGEKLKRLEEAIRQVATNPAGGVGSSPNDPEFARVTAPGVDGLRAGGSGMMRAGGSGSMRAGG